MIPESAKLTPEQLKAFPFRKRWYQTRQEIADAASEKAYEQGKRDGILKDLRPYMDCPIRKADGILYYQYHVPKSYVLSLKETK